MIDQPEKTNKKEKGKHGPRDFFVQDKANARSFALEIAVFRQSIKNSDSEEAKRIEKRALEIQNQYNTFLNDPQMAEAYGINRIKNSANTHNFSKEQLQSGAAAAEKMTQLWSAALHIMQEMRDEVRRLKLLQKRKPVKK